MVERSGVVGDGMDRKVDVFKQGDLFATVMQTEVRALILPQASAEMDGDQTPTVGKGGRKGDTR